MLCPLTARWRGGGASGQGLLLRIHIYFYVLQRKYCLKIGKGKRTKEPKSYGPSRKWGGGSTGTQSPQPKYGEGGGREGNRLTDRHFGLQGSYTSESTKELPSLNQVFFILFVKKIYICWIREYA